MTEPQKGAGRRRRAQTPQRVQTAAGAMASSQGTTRGYVPVPYGGQQSQPYGVPAGGAQPTYGAPQGNPYQIPQGNPYAAPQGSQQAYPGQQRANPGRYQTGSYESIGGHRGYVAMQAPPQPKPKKARKGLRAFLIILLVAVFGAGGAFAYMSYQKTKEINDAVQPFDGLFVPGVYVDGIDLEGMTPEQALNSVQSQIRQRNDAWSVQLTYEGNVVATIDAAMLNLSVDISEVMNRAWQQGHEGNYEERYVAMQELRANPYHANTATPSGDTAMIDALMSGIKESIDTPAVDAALVSFDPSLSYPFTFTDEVYGKRLDIEPVIEHLYEMVSEMKNGSVELKPETVYPNVTKVELQKHYALRSSVYTPISSISPVERNQNIARALEIINGYVLEPGKKFSFNGVVGQRTTANGFQPAVEYVYNEHVMGVGGGVCQASTTVYQAAVNAGLKILHREPHSDSVTYTDYGMDATVYWEGKRKIDLEFKNDTESNIYIVSSVQQDPSNKRRQIAKVTMYGEDLGEIRYQLVSEIVQELEPPENPEYVKDTKGEYVTYTDQQKSVSKAKPGYVVKSYRLEYTGTTLTAKKELDTDTYKPQAEKIYVGVKKRGE